SEHPHLEGLEAGAGRARLGRDHAQQVFRELDPGPREAFQPPPARAARQHRGRNGPDAAKTGLHAARDAEGRAGVPLRCRAALCGSLPPSAAGERGPPLVRRDRDPA
ncbi:unnamed protein product, partial [Prorocentrum cordatum]